MSILGYIFRAVFSPILNMVGMMGMLTVASILIVLLFIVFIFVFGIIAAFLGP